MNDVVVGILGWVGIIAVVVWLCLFIKMMVSREVTPELKNFHTSTLDDTESIEYKHTVMASDE